MVNGKWFEKEMARAEEHIAAHGYEDSDLRAIMLVGFQYVATKERHTLRVKVDGKAWLSASILLGGLVGSAIQVVL